MLIDIRKQSVSNIEEYNKYETSQMKIYYRGLFFTRKLKEGYESLQYISNYLENSGINEPQILFNELMGSFIMVILKKDGDIIVFSDNNNMQGFYLSDDCISDSLIQVIKFNEGAELNREATCEYIRYGQTFFNKTLIDGVNISETSSFYVINSGKILKFEKNLELIKNKSYFNNYSDFFGHLNYALGDLKKSLALTGGFDSRLIFSLMFKDNSLDTCISGNDLADRDIVISQKVATMGGAKHEIEIVEKPIISDEYYYKLFVEREGALIGFSDDDIRIGELLRRRKQKGYNVHITGDTGIFHKDEYWIQDYPFYSKKHFNVERFYKYRILVIDEKMPLSDEMIGIDGEIRNKIISWLKDNKQETNTKSYDWYSRYLRHETGIKQVISSSSNIIDTYCPLLELEAIKISYNLPRLHRLGGKAMKIAITNANSSIAKIPTWTGSTTSSELKYYLRDLFFNIINYFKKALRLAGRIFFKSTFLTGNVTTWKTEEDFRNLEVVRKAFIFAKEQKIVDNSCEYEGISTSLLRKLLYIYFLCQ